MTKENEVFTGHKGDGPCDHVPAGDGAGRLQALYRLSASMVAAPTVEWIYQAAIDALTASLPIQRAAVLLLDPDGVLRFKAWRGLSDDYRRAAEGHSSWHDGDTDPQPVVVADVAADESLAARRATILAEGIGALAFIPLLYGARLLGTFMLYADGPRQFDSDEIALAVAVGGHIAFALEKGRLEDELRLSAEQLVATLNAVSEGITVQAPDGSLISANEAAAEWLGFASVADLLAASVSDITARFEILDGEGRPISISRLPGRAALRGAEPAELLVRSRLVGNHTERFSLVTARPVRDDGGAVRFAVNVFRDVTDRQVALEALRASEARLAFLAAASRRLLTTALEPRQVLEEVAELVVPALADWCTVREFADDGRLERVAVAPGQHPLYSGLEIYGDLFQDNPALPDLAAGRSILVPEITRAMLERRARDDEHLALLEQLGLRSAMMVPLRTRGETIGVLNMAVGSGRGPYSAADLALAEEFAGRVAAKVDSARLFANEHATAETLARALLPGRLPDIPGLKLGACYRAAGEVGGDFYDCFPIGEATWMLVVGDVCGRGIHAASMTGLTRHKIRAAALHATSPAAVLADLNQLLLHAADAHMAAWMAQDDGGEPSYCTVCLAAVTATPTGAHVVVSTAGHPLPIVVRANAELTEVGQPGSLLGVMVEVDLSEHTCELRAGDALVLFTDGITERRQAGQLFGEGQLAATLRHLAGADATHLVDQVERAAVSFATAAPLDDMAVLAVSVPAADAGSMLRP